MTYKQHMTTEYDTQFKKVKELRWDPWVGKNYNETGIFVLGASTDQRHGSGDWTRDLANPRDASRVLVAWVNEETEKPFDYAHGRDALSFQNTAKIFIEGVGAQYDERSIAAFWEAVAFNNYYQVVVESIGDVPGQPEVEKSKTALYASVEIVKPKLILAWETDLRAFWLGHRKGVQKIGRVTPHVVEQIQPDYFAPIAGISHASRINRSACLEFLLADPISKKPIREFLDHLEKRLANGS